MNNVQYRAEELEPLILFSDNHLLRQYNAGGTIERGEMLLTGADGVMDLPNGNWVRWMNK